jgi:zinc transport system permease protein
MIAALFEYGFMRNAFYVSILASIACGIMGTVIVEKKLVMMSGGIAHASFGGIGLGYLLGVEPIYAALVFSAGTSVGIATLRRKTSTGSDVLVAMLWSAGMALGILFLSLAPGYPPDMTSYLFGNILTVPVHAVLATSALVLAIILFVVSMFHYLKAFMFDEEFFQSMGLKTTVIEYLLFVMISFTVVILIKVVGIILVVALLTVPPAIARMFTYSLHKIMLYSVLLGAAFCLAGLWISYTLDTASGASIILVAATGYLLSAAFSKLKDRHLKKGIKKAI